MKTPDRQLSPPEPRAPEPDGDERYDEMRQQQLEDERLDEFMHPEARRAWLRYRLIRTIHRMHKTSEIDITYVALLDLLNDCYEELSDERRD